MKVLSPAFYALGDARTPMLISLGSIAVNYSANYLMVKRFGHVGLAASTSVVALVNFVLLLLFMRHKLGHIEGRVLFGKILRICAATLVMAIAAGAANGLAGTLPLSGLTLRLARVSAALGLAALAFYWGCRFFQVVELHDAVQAIGGRLLRRLRPKK